MGLLLLTGVSLTERSSWWHAKLDGLLWKQSWSLPFYTRTELKLWRMQDGVCRPCGDAARRLLRAISTCLSVCVQSAVLKCLAIQGWMCGFWMNEEWGRQNLNSIADDIWTVSLCGRRDKTVKLLLLSGVQCTGFILCCVHMFYFIFTNLLTGWKAIPVVKSLQCWLWCSDLEQLDS